MNDARCMMNGTQWMVHGKCSIQVKTMHNVSKHLKNSKRCNMNNHDNETYMIHDVNCGKTMTVVPLMNVVCKMNTCCTHACCTKLP